LFIRSLCEGLARCRDVAANSERESARGTVEPIDQTIQDGEYFARAFLLLAHGAKVTPLGIVLFDDDGRTVALEIGFDRREPDDWEASALKIIKAGRRTDPDAFSSWRPYRRN
jgi:hypothetical protein